MMKKDTNLKKTAQKYTKNSNRPIACNNSCSKTIHFLHKKSPFGLIAFFAFQIGHFSHPGQKRNITILATMGCNRDGDNIIPWYCQQGI